MGLSFAQTLGNALQSREDARTKQIEEQQKAQELAMRQQSLAKTLQMEQIRLQIDKARQATEEGRYASEQERLKTAGWSKVGQDTQNADGTWTSNWYNASTGEHREFRQGTPKAVAIQDTKGDQALDLEKQRNKDKLEQIAASGRWHMRWAALAAQGKLKKEDWNALKTDPGYMQSVYDMKAAIAERNMILSKMYSTVAPATPEQLAGLNQQLQQVEQRLNKASQSAEQVRNRVRFGVDQLGVKNSISGAISAAGGGNKVKTLTSAKRDEYLRQAGGNRDKARAMAIKDGYDISKVAD
jgi:hypothetical protein